MSNIDFFRCKNHNVQTHQSDEGQKQFIAEEKLEKISFNVTWNKCKIIQRADGYQYYNKQYGFYSVDNILLTVGQL